MTPKGVVLLSSWLKSKGYSFELIKRYRHSGWLESIGTGAMIRAGDPIDHYGALYALQNQKKLKIHMAARTALSLLNKSHYVELAPQKVILFGSRKAKLPAWFIEYNWQIAIEYYSTDFLPPTLGLSTIPIKDFEISISNEIRALMECLYLAPKHQELTECYELMESMNNLHPEKVQELLEHCTSIKVKRLFLCLAEKIGHEWFKHLDTSKINLGKGKRSIVPHGHFDPKYQITVPAQWERK